MDSIIIRDLEVDTIIGIFPHEREEKQKVIINIELFCDLTLVGKSDDFNDSLDYSKIESETKNLVANSSCFLVEKLANLIADKLLEFDKAKAVTITVDKPKAAQFAKSIAIKIHREK